MRTFLRALLPILALGGGFGIFAWQMAHRPVLAGQAPESPAPLVRVIELQPEDRRLEVRTHGTIQALDPLPLAPEVGGRVVSVSPSLVEGGFCAEGEILFELDPADLRIALDQAEARLAQAEAALRLEEAAAEVAVADWSALGRGEPNALVRHEPQLARARAEQAAAAAARDRAVLDLERTKVRAPFAARIQEVDLAPGRILTPGTPVATLLPTEAAEVVLPLSLEDLDRIGLDLGGRGLDLEVTLRAEVGGRPLVRSGRLNRLLPDLDPATHMVRAVVRIEDPFALAGDQPPVAPALFVEATVPGRLVRGVFALPAEAVREGNRVYLAGGDDRLEIRTIEPIQIDRDEILVGAGLAAGERLVLGEVPVPVAGMPLRIEEPER
ncbi:MAG: efflux RND transporter periplasmic adaptor subunit [Planctomycetota bacterium]|nr:MAG: efflux RND transporter periplasmic adaptor subunit [Planctomycetota bacterium]